MAQVSLASIESAVFSLCPQVRDLHGGADWNDLSEQSLFKELTACALGNQVSYEHALSATNVLDAKGLLKSSAMDVSIQCLLARIEGELSRPAMKPLRSCGRGRTFRFPATGAKCVSTNLQQIYGSGQSLKSILRRCGEPTVARRYLSQSIYGVGPKQASLFLRNIGYTDSLAILDRHVLSYMSIVGLLPTVPRSVSTFGKYEALEDRLSSYAYNFGHELSSLDLAIWVVMRVVKRDISHKGSLSWQS